MSGAFGPKKGVPQFWHRRGEDIAWAAKVAAERNAARERNLCAGAQPRCSFAYTTVHNHTPVVIEIRGTMSFAPQLLIHKEVPV